VNGEIDIEQVKSAFAETLLELRKEAGLSQEKLANKAHLERAYVSRLERSLVQPSLSTLIKISNSLEIDLSVLINKFLKHLNG